MRKYLLFTGIIILSILLIGCGGKNKEVSICEKVESLFTDYNDDATIMKKLKEIYDQECTGEDYKTCSSINDIINDNKSEPIVIETKITYLRMDCSRLIDEQ